VLKVFKISILVVIFFLKPAISVGQESIQVYVHAGESLSIHPAEPVGISSNVINAGSLGTYPGSALNFSGNRWTNRLGSKLIDESADGLSGMGGTFRFSGQNGSQIIDNQNIPSALSGFANLAISNTDNLILEGGNLTVNRNLTFVTGRLILNNRNAILGSNATISEYDNTKFVVTGTGVNGGYLIRNIPGTSSADIVYPVGSTVNSYTPASLSYRGVSQNIQVRVFDNVYDKAVYGMPDNVNYVPKTWNVSFAVSDPSAVLTLNTQHNASEEGGSFSANRIESYISRYITSTEQWDKSVSTGVHPGSLTTGNPIANAFLSSRTAIGGLSLNEYFSKSMVKTNASPIAGLRIPVGISPNNDGLNDKFVIENLKPGDRVRLDIYNRWQTLVFRDANYQNSFNGVGNQKGLINNELPDGTYYYILNVNTEKPITGYIVINR
jgi:gliding motility-associated-like protein